MVESEFLRRQCVRILRNLGFKVVRLGPRVQMEREGRRIEIPPGERLSRWELATILREADVPSSEFMRRMRELIDSEA